MSNEKIREYLHKIREGRLAYTISNYIDIASLQRLIQRQSQQTISEFFSIRERYLWMMGQKKTDCYEGFDNENMN